MFGGAYFGKTYFGGTYFGPNVEVHIVVQKKQPVSTSSSGGDYTVKTVQVAKEDLSERRKAIIAQLVREDEELIAVIVTAIQEGIL